MISMDYTYTLLNYTFIDVPTHDQHENMGPNLL